MDTQTLPIKLKIEALRDTHKASSQYQDFKGKDLSGHDFSGQDLTGSNFVEANLEGANFNDCILYYANFKDANTRLARFDRAKVYGTPFQEEYLRHIRTSRSAGNDVVTDKPEWMKELDALIREERKLNKKGR